MSNNQEESNNDNILIMKTANFAALKHVDQRRKVGDVPYINHPIGVANIITEIGGLSDVKIIQGALLHDTVEDTDTTLDEIEEVFGSEIRKIVDEVTDNKDLSKDERKKHQIEHAPHCSYEAKCVKLADKLYNLRDLLKSPPSGWSKDRIIGYFVWSKAVIDSIKGTNAEIENALYDIFDNGSIEYDGITFDVIPKDKDLSVLLENYYEELKPLDD
eukprot:TRINITY_DN1662_c0_g1_i2.p1 TRINITY_DN1662_c0_g1~~TRINITY_DN1662_c0_g1_i2.p1  ORF type:complete len:216 (-),score=71.19 TRINITY_DN1662_c0_g1_i2:132-779(-)